MKKTTKKAPSTRILAVLQHLSGIGSSRHWNALLFDTDVQSHVEQFMLSIRQPGYFLLDPDELTKDREGNMMFGGFRIMATPVYVKHDRKGIRFAVRHQA
jgi:hypothetical protein